MSELDLDTKRKFRLPFWFKLELNDMKNKSKDLPTPLKLLLFALMLFATRFHNKNSIQCCATHVNECPFMFNY